MRKNKNNRLVLLVLYIVLAILSLELVGMIVWLAVRFSPHGEPYVVIPCVAGFLAAMLVLLFALIKIYPYAVERDKKRLKKKSFKCGVLSVDIEELKKNAGGNFGEGENGKYKKIVNGNWIRPHITYFFEFEAEGGSVTERIKTKRINFDYIIQANRMRAATVCFIEVEKYENQFESLERALDDQYISAWGDPCEVIVPIVYERSTKQVYYYEKWSKLNFTTLAFATKYVKKLLF